MEPRNAHKPAPADPVSGMTFEQALDQVEKIIDRIEKGQGLERSLAEYERGVTLIRHCRGILDRAEQRIEELTAQMDGGPATDSNGEPRTDTDDADSI